MNLLRILFGDELSITEIQEKGVFSKYKDVIRCVTKTDKKMDEYKWILKGDSLHIVFVCLFFT